MTADYILAPNPSGLEMRTEINAIFSAILSQNSSATEPTSTVAGMFWYDTTTSVFKQRNSTNDGWVDKWDTSKGMLASLASPTFTGNVNMPSTSYIAGNLIASLASPIFTGTVTMPNLTVNTSVSLPAATSIGSVSQTELSYLDGVTSAIQTQLNGKQATLVSGANIKTVQGQSLLGSGDITIPSDTITSIFANFQEFTASGTFTVPAGVYKVYVMGCGGGAGGGGGGKGVTGTGGFGGSGGGGGSSNFSTPYILPVTPGAGISVVIGAGGAGGAGATTSGSAGGSGSPGGDTSFGEYIFHGSAYAGGGGSGSSVTYGKGGGGGAGASKGGTSGIGGAGGTVPTAGGNAIEGAFEISFATGGAGGSETVGIGSKGTCQNGLNGSPGISLGNGGNGGAGGAGKVIVYW